MNEMPPEASTFHCKPVILELVGPAGAGKTTLRRMLLDRFKQARLLNYPRFREIRSAPFFIKNTLKLLPFLLRVITSRKGRQITLEELVLLVILNGWPPLLKQQAMEHEGFTILDQGPVYILALLDHRGPPRLHTPSATAWMDQEYKNWAETIKVIIYLDTADQTLFHRINNRGKNHGVVGKPMDETQEFLERSRKSLNQAIFDLRTRNQNLCVYRFNTSEKTAEEISEEVVNIVNHSL